MKTLFRVGFLIAVVALVGCDSGPSGSNTGVNNLPKLTEQDAAEIAKDDAKIADEEQANSFSSRKQAKKK